MSSHAVEPEAWAPPAEDERERTGGHIGWPPIGRRDLLDLFIAYVALVAVFVMIGLAVTRIAPLESLDRRVSESLASHRTPHMTTASWWGSMLAETWVKILVTALVAGVMLAVWRRWREPLMVVVPLVLEACVFITVTFIVHRPRPDVERLDGSPVGSSFPSGHTAAAAAYAAIVIVIFWHTRARWARILATIVAIALPIVVGYARAYRGMHYLTDVTAGTVLGLVCVAVSWWLLERRFPERHTGHHNA